MDKIISTLAADPFVTTVVVGMLWPLAQAALDKPWWTKGRRAALLAAISVLMSVGIWAAGAYPGGVEWLLKNTTMLLGIAWSTFQVLSSIRVNGVRLVDWVGIFTPGGETRESLPIDR